MCDISVISVFIFVGSYQNQPLHQYSLYGLNSANIHTFSVTVECYDAFTMMAGKYTMTAERKNVTNRKGIVNAPSAALLLL